MSDTNTQTKQPEIWELNKDVRVKFDASAIPLLAPFIATRSLRFYLEGLRIEEATDKPAGGLYLIATDGYRLSIVYDPTGSISGHNGRGLTMKVTPEMVRICRKASIWPRQVLATGLRVSLSRDFGHEHTDHEEYVMPGQPWIGGGFPDWRKVMPVFKRLQPGLMQEVNAKYLEVYAKLGQDKKSQVKFWHTSTTGVAVVQLAAIPQFLSLLMPMNPQPEEWWLERMKPIMSTKPVAPDDAANDLVPLEKAA